MKLMKLIGQKRPEDRRVSTRSSLAQSQLGRPILFQIPPKSHVSTRRWPTRDQVMIAESQLGGLILFQAPSNSHVSTRRWPTRDQFMVAQSQLGDLILFQIPPVLPKIAHISLFS